MIPSMLNVFTLQGYLVINSIIGGQTLASVSNNLSWSVGIVIISIISLIVKHFPLSSMSSVCLMLCAGDFSGISCRPLVRMTFVLTFNGILTRNLGMRVSLGYQTLLFLSSCWA